ncbi:unnamed protein product [Amoebophrya sp. A120]|nr:unnamed protein product [Amoebophrya sp. A120]|eukprot:GSA120T00023937001.1
MREMMKNKNWDVEFIGPPKEPKSFAGEGVDDVPKKMKMRIHFYFDSVSPYANLAWHVLRRYEKIWDFELVLKPIFLGGVMKQTGNRPPGLLPQKAPYLVGEMQRARAFFNLPHLESFPPDNFFDKEFQKSYITVQRVLVAVIGDQMWEKEKKYEAIQNAFDLVHSTGKVLDGRVGENQNSIPPVTDDLILDTILGGGHDGNNNTLHPDVNKKKAALLEQAKSSAAVKQKLADNTKEAIEEHGAFGAPWLVVERSETSRAPAKVMKFFGSDRFEEIAFFFEKPWYGPDPLLKSKHVQSRL